MEKKSYIEQLVSYFIKNLKKGYTEESLKWALINQGYSKISVEKALKLANEELAKKAPKFIEKPVIKYEIIEEKTPHSASLSQTQPQNKLKVLFKKLKRKLKHY